MATMERLMGFLENVAEGWREASQEQRNRLERALFKAVKVRER